jgi:hypothetical protein
MKKEDLIAALEAIGKSGIKVAGDLVLEKHVEQEVANVEPGGIGIQINNGSAAKAAKPAAERGKQDSGEKPEKPRETMTFGRKGGVTDGHLTLLYRVLVKKGWIDGNEADFKALFSGKIDEDCGLTWKGMFGKGTLVELFKQCVAEGLVTIADGFTLSAILEGHFKDTNGAWLTGLDKGNPANDKALPIIKECVKLMKASPEQLIYGDYDDDEDFKSEYDPYDHQDLNLHKR